MPAIDTDVKSVRRMFEVNLFGPMQMVYSFHDMLIRTSGVIVNIGSIGGVVPYVYGGMMLPKGILVCSEFPRLGFTANLFCKRRIMPPRLRFITIPILCVLKCHLSSRTIFSSVLDFY